MAAKYVLGIDLGTTNSVVAYAPLDAKSPEIELLEIPQLVAANTIEVRHSLPSFLYIAPEHEASSGALDLPWESRRRFAVGEFARRQGAEMPERTVVAAKSWLAHSRVDRRQPILPYGAPAEVDEISPVSASQRYLEHLIGAWNQKFPDAPAEQQLVVLTVPASFDAAARELTREAALAAGLPTELVLLEEPQAAVYSWLAVRGDRWRKDLTAGDRLLVCDIGGGTTDLTLIDVAEKNGELELRRLAVGDHLLVGGDNMDLALAYRVAELFAERGVKLNAWQSVSLWHSCRDAKESLLGSRTPETYPVSVLGRGSKLVGGTVTVDVPRQMAIELLVGGFFPACELTDKPKRGRQSGFQEIGLPFETDVAITRHLASFLSAQSRSTGEAAAPTHMLFNGGVFKADVLRSRILSTLGRWFSAEGSPSELPGQRDLEYAVARAPLFTAGPSSTAACAFAAAPRARITSASRPPAWRSPAHHVRSAPFASCRSGWRKEPASTCRPVKSAWCSGSSPTFASSARTCATAIGLATCCLRSMWRSWPKQTRWKLCLKPAARNKRPMCP